MPFYLYSLLFVYAPVRCLHSSSCNLLCKPLYKLKAPESCFTAASSSVWNDISEYVKSSESINVFSVRL